MNVYCTYSTLVVILPFSYYSVEATLTKPFPVDKKSLFVPRVNEGSLSVTDFYLTYNIWQDTGIFDSVLADF